MKVVRLYEYGGPEKTDYVYSLDRAADAQVALAGRKTSGKVLLVP
jgi:NADPH:quinone reductase-like Zn-dependent oxidoreductase